MLLREILFRRLAASVAVAAQAGQKQDPNNPFAGIIITASASISEKAAPTAIAVTEQQQQNNPGPVISGAATASHGVATSAVGSR